MHLSISIAAEKDISEICIFIRDEYYICKDWPEYVLSPWIEWNVKSGFCVIGREIFEDSKFHISGRIKTLLLGRPASDLIRARDETFYNDREGDKFFVDLVITEFPKAVTIMTEAMIKSVGVKYYLAFARDHGNIHKVHTYKLDKFLKRYEPRTTKIS